MFFSDFFFHFWLPLIKLWCNNTPLFVFVIFNLWTIWGVTEASEEDSEQQEQKKQNKMFENKNKHPCRQPHLHGDRPTAWREEGREREVKRRLPSPAGVRRWGQVGGVIRRAVHLRRQLVKETTRERTWKDPDLFHFLFFLLTITTAAASFK